MHAVPSAVILCYSVPSTAVGVACLECALHCRLLFIPLCRSDAASVAHAAVGLRRLPRGPASQAVEVGRNGLCLRAAHSP
jgi:hypothetical protein